MVNANAAALIAKIGNVIASVEIDEVLYTLSADAIVRVNDVETGFFVHHLSCPSMAKAEAVYADTIEKAAKLAA